MVPVPGIRSNARWFAASSLAALSLLAACADSGPVSGPDVRKTIIAGSDVANAALVTICIAGGSPAGTYTVSTAGSDVSPTNFGGPSPLPATANINVGDCTNIFTRNGTTDVNGQGDIPSEINAAFTVIPATAQLAPGVDAVTCVVAASLGAPDDCVEPDAGEPTPAVINVRLPVNRFHGSVATFDFDPIPVVQSPPLFLILDEDAIDNGSMPNRFSASNVNDDIARLGQRNQLRWFRDNVGASIVLHSGGMGDEGWFAPKTIPASWANTGPTSNGLRNFLGLPVGPGLGAGSDPEKYLDKIPNVTPLRAEGLYMLIGRLVCAVVYDSDISINYGPLNGSLKGENLGIVAFTVTNVERLTGYSSGSLPKVTLTVANAVDVCGGAQTLFTEAPVITSSSSPVDVKPNQAG